MHIYLFYLLTSPSVKRRGEEEDPLLAMSQSFFDMATRRNPPRCAESTTTTDATTTDVTTMDVTTTDATTMYHHHVRDYHHDICDYHRHVCDHDIPNSLPTPSLPQSSTIDNDNDRTATLREHAQLNEGRGETMRGGDGHCAHP